MPDVAAELGHARFDMTLRAYTHSIRLPGRSREAAEKMARELIRQETATKQVKQLK